MTIITRELFVSSYRVQLLTGDMFDRVSSVSYRRDPDDDRGSGWRLETTASSIFCFLSE